jgi:cobyrinic acid a,c-diamide synthase
MSVLLRLPLAAPMIGSGKTTLTTGLIAALAARFVAASKAFQQRLFPDWKKACAC